MYEFGAAMGAEFKGKGANVVLAPMLILTRVPNDGRSFESIGEVRARIRRVPDCVCVC